MPTYYVDSTATGSNTGGSWANAYTAFASAVSVASAGDTILVDDGHSETGLTNPSYTLPNDSGGDNPVRILCVDKADDSLSTGAIISCEGANALVINGAIYVYGITFEAGSTMTINATGGNNNRYVFESCTLQSSAAASGGNRRLIVGVTGTHTGLLGVFRSCLIDFDTYGNSNSDVIIQGGRFVFQDCTIKVDSTSPSIFDSSGRWGMAEFYGCDFSSNSTTYLIEQAVSPCCWYLFSGCRLPSSYTLVNGSPHADTRIRLDNCASGTISVPALPINHYYDAVGETKTVLAQYRTNGAWDGEQANSYSWQVTTTANAQEIFAPHEMPPIVRWVNGGSSITATIYIASGATLNNDDFWVEIYSPNETASPNQTALQNFYTNRCDPQATPAALTTDTTSAWNGTGVGTKQKITRTFTPTEAGPVVVRCFFAKPSTTIYVDPQIEIS